MIKKSFRLMLLGAFALLSSVFVACDKYDDDIEGLQAQIDALKATVQSLQSEIDGGAVITNVAESSTGVTVTLSNGKSFTISNGTDGEDGAAGTPGSVVEIGENGNWFIDGEDTGIAAAGEDGQLGSVEVGENGHLIINGEDTGIVAAGITAVYENGVVTLYGVEGLEDGYVIGSASHIASLAVVPENWIEGLGLPAYQNFIIFDKEGEFVASNNFEVTYRVNPTNANVDSVEFSFLNRFAQVVRAAEADETDAVEFVSVAKSENIPGAIDVTAKLSDSFVPVKYADDNYESVELNLFALKAANVDGCEIVSDYAVVFPMGLDSLELVNIYACEEDYHHVLTVDSCANVYDAADSHRDAYMYYDGTLDLNEVVSLFELDLLNDAIANYGFDVEYTFSDEKVFKGQDGMTDQNKFVKLDGSVLSVDKEFLKANPQGGKAAIGRTPLIFVEAKIAGVVIDTASIKIEITEKEVVIVKDSIVLEVGPQDFEYSDINDETMMTLPWERFNIEVYEKLGLDAQSFWDIYTTFDIESEPGVEVIYEYVDYEEAPTSTDIAGLAFDPYEVQLGDGVATLKLISSDPRYKDVLIKFVYNIYHNPQFPALNPDYLLEKKQAIDTNEYEVVRVKGKLIDGVWALQSEMKEFCENYLEGYVQPGNHNALKFRIEGLVKDGALLTLEDTTDFGACLVDADGNDIELSTSGDKDVDIKLTTPLGADEPSRVYLIRMSQFMHNGQRCVKYFCVEFVRPFDMTIDNLTLKTLIAKADSVCVDSAVVIKDLDGKVIYEKCDVTEYAQEVYNFSKDNFEFTYDLSELDATWGNEDNKKLTLVTDAEGNTYIRWYNGGGELQNNKYLMPEDEEFNVTVSIENLAAQEVFPKVTVLSSANSK